MTQEKDENPVLFLSGLTKAVQKYTNLDISTPARLLYVHIQFISQLSSDICQKLCKLEKGPETPQQDLLEIAFKVFNNKEEEAKKEKEIKKKKWKEWPNMFYSLQRVKKKIQPLWPINLGPPVWDLTLQAPASDVTKWDTGLISPAQTPSRPPNPAPLANNGATGKWIVLRHYPPNLGVHPRPNSNGPGTRLRGTLAPQTMVPWMR